MKSKTPSQDTRVRLPTDFVVRTSKILKYCWVWKQLVSPHALLQRVSPAHPCVTTGGHRGKRTGDRHCLVHGSASGEPMLWTAPGPTAVLRQCWFLRILFLCHSIIQFLYLWYWAVNCWAEMSQPFNYDFEGAGTWTLWEKLTFSTALAVILQMVLGIEILWADFAVFIWGVKT